LRNAPALRPQGFARFRLGFVTILSPASFMTLEIVSTFA
jgi:hypothetical protein